MLPNTRGCRVSSSREIPCAMAVMASASSARKAPSREPDQTLSVKVMAARYLSRWRVSTGRSSGSKGLEPATCKTSSDWMRRTKSRMSAMLPGRRPRSRSLAKDGPPTQSKLTLLPPTVMVRAGLRAVMVNSLGALATCSSISPGSKRTVISPSSTWAPAAFIRLRASGHSILRPASARTLSDAR